MTAVEGVLPFDVCGPLPQGVTVLEASAGTGKTFTIAALAARYVAEGTPLEQLLLVTFTRMATGELRERVRERLVTAEDGLARAMAGAAPPHDDRILQLLATGSADDVALRHARLARALAEFDSATIATTHGFCELVLSGLGIAGDVERDATFVEDIGDLVAEVVDDFYVRKFHRDRTKPPFDRNEALRIARKVVDNPFAPVEPVDASADSVPGLRRRLAVAVRDEVDRRKRRLNLVTYDDLLGRLRTTLADPVRGPGACERLRARYRVTLVDEFQDTDPVQWEILRLGFGTGESTLVLIGDPKQAIYAFRGADVYAYLDAARQAGTKATLEVNWRADQGLLDAYDTIFRGTKLGHAGIPYRRVEAAPAHNEARLTGAPIQAPLRVRVVRRDSGVVQLTQGGYVAAAAGRSHVAADLSADLARLLSSPAEIVSRREDGVTVGRERIRPGHVAVLVRTNRDAALVRDALDTAGIPAVIHGAGSVFGTTPAREWLRLLEALERPTSPTRAASAALTTFLGWTVEQVASADERGWEDVHARLHRWAALLRRRGVASLLETITHAEGLPRRILARDDGERALTDLRHVGQLLHSAATSGQLGVTALTAWLRQRIAEAAEDTANEERSRRLESDAEAVQVLTVHRSKGLEFPVVYFPCLWDRAGVWSQDLPVFHDPDAGDLRTVDVGGGGRGFSRRRKLFVDEQAGEELRLAYVALTRAQHQAVVWWAGSWDSRDSPLSRLLFARLEGGEVAAQRDTPPTDDEVVACFEALAAAAPGCISVERSDAGAGAAAKWSGEPGAPAADLQASGFHRPIDRQWGRTSYSAITADAHEPRVGSEPEHLVIVDEPPAGPPGAPVEPDGSSVAGEAALRSVPLPLAAMPGGAEVGTFVHSVISTTDFAAADLDAALAVRVAAEQARQAVEIGDLAEVVAGLRAAIDTPLGPLVGDVRLRDITPADRVDEMGFELPLAGGDAPGAELAVHGIASLLREHVPPGGVLSGYADALEDPSLHGDLRGFLTGSLDLVLRTRHPDGAARFTVIDHKTNWLGVDGEPLSSWHYRPAALEREMRRSHYGLQALLYSVALHRYLRWRMPGYDPARNLGGVLYLFLRGMAGPDTPRVEGQPCGVFSWEPQPELVLALSDFLDRGLVPG